MIKFGIHYTARVMNLAAENGHLETVKWLHEKSITDSDRYACCTDNAMDWAAKTMILIC